ncbi:DNA polymerase III subunit gamma/tau [Aeoliella mucimassa]|uniref:DNA polymerase III subunit gamma/tau n=1 Tax=Aeoliella mucimassa TaxID=2527972 RepID=A0A518ATR6_9BACT|nr:DNA polymerase III subunit gamma/tau [Aeoliella mucimassa]QDU58121.1 DNA polymerase III subunit tau [Aeoliella mucimassa]
MDETAAATPKSNESYTVVARRYRPQTFDELIGQQHVAKALKQAISTGRIGHAYLFTGARGVGKTSAARVLAKALNCQQGPTPTPCNECDVCKSVTSGEDVDVIEIDGASNRQIDDIRQLRQNVAIRPSRVPFKVYIIDEVHMLTKEAFNALLKTLEEPPEHVKFIFATTDPQKVPITILSRCQRFDFAGIESTAIAGRLQQIASAEGVEIDDEALAVLSIRAAGSMRDSQSLLEQLLAVAGSQITANEVYTLLGIAPGERIGRLVTSIVDRNPAAALSNLDEAVAGGAEVGQLIDQLLGYFRDVMAMVVGCDTSQLRFVLPSQYDLTRELGQRLGVHTVLAMIQVLDQTASRMRGSLHTRTLAETAVVRLAHLDDLDNLAAAIAELRTGQPTPTRSAPAPQAAVKKNDDAPEMSFAEAAAQLGNVPAKPSPPPRPAPTATAPEPTPSPPAVAVAERTPPPATAAPPQAAAPAEASHRVDPPTPATAKAPVSLTNESVKQAWRTMADDLGMILTTHAEAAHDVRLSDDNNSVVVSFAPGARLSKSQCEIPENRSSLENSMAQQLGCSVALKFEVDESAKTPDNGNAAAPPPRAVSRRQLQTEVAERPFVAKAIELFAADPTKLRVTPPGKSTKR